MGALSQRIVARQLKRNIYFEIGIADTDHQLLLLACACYVFYNALLHQVIAVLLQILVIDPLLDTDLIYRIHGS